MNTSKEECDATKAVEAEHSEATDSQANVDHSSLEGVSATNVASAAAATAACEKLQFEATAQKLEASPEAGGGEQSEPNELQANLDSTSLEGIDATEATAIAVQSEMASPKAEAAPQALEGEQTEATELNAHVEFNSLDVVALREAKKGAVAAANAARVVEKVQSETTAPEETGPNHVAEIQAVVEELQSYACPQNSAASMMGALDLVCEAKLPSEAAGSNSHQGVVHRQEVSGAAHLREVGNTLRAKLAQSSAATTPGKLSPTLRAVCKKEEVLAKVVQDQESMKKKLFVFGKSPMKSSTNQVAAKGTTFNLSTVLSK